MTLEANHSLYVTILVIYVSIFLDNTLLTIVVPILPYLLNNGNTTTMSTNHTVEGNYSNPTEIFLDNSPKRCAIETEKAAVLLSSKSIVQLAINPLVAVFVPKIGYILSMLIGNFVLLVTSLAFAHGGSFLILSIARSLHGVASVIITVSGMCICAEKFSSDDRMRSKYMGIILGSEALGVLTGYTVGAFVYNIGGKSAPFALLSFLLFLNTGLLLMYMDTIWIHKEMAAQMNLASQKTHEVMQLMIVYMVFRFHKTSTEKSVTIDLAWCHFLRNSFILLIFGALFFSSSTVAVLEPSLPAWLIGNSKIEKWQTSLIFLPDSFGYLISTSTFGTLPHRIGKWKTATLALCMIGTCLIMIPSVDSLLHLAVPHFCTGLGFGTVDVVLIPMLANFVDLHQNTPYSSVYALQQAATSLAYIFGSLLAGESIHLIGFAITVRTMGVFIVLYSALFGWYGRDDLLLNGRTSFADKTSDQNGQHLELISMEKHTYYHALFESDGSD